MNAQRSCECDFCPIRLRGSCSALEGMSAVTPQGMDDQALEVLKAAKPTQALLAIPESRGEKKEHMLMIAIGVLSCHRAWTTRPWRC